MWSGATVGPDISLFVCPSSFETNKNIWIRSTYCVPSVSGAVGLKWNEKPTPFLPLLII